MIYKGEKAPDFILKNQASEEIKLSDYVGKKVVLYFYPRDNTSGCTTEACGLRDVYDEILELGAVVLGVSTDSEASHQKFINKHNLPFHLLADIDHKVSDAYEAWGEKKMYGKVYFGIKRMTYIIDKKGMIQHVFPKVSPKKHADEILEILKNK
jgi:peroxiredoxin Q/BCP